MIASAGRDRMIQLYEANSDAKSLELLQTLDCHGSSVNKLLFHHSSKALLSASSDRTIAISMPATLQEAVAFVPVRIITLKQSPIGMTLDSLAPSSLLVSTMDKQLLRYDIQTAQLIDAIRLVDNTSGAITLSAITHLVIEGRGLSQAVVLGACSADKSLRVHCSTSGATLVKDFLHAEGITELFLLKVPGDRPRELGRVLVSTGLDGTVTLWNLLPLRPQHSQDNPNSLLAHGKPKTLPLRRVLSRATLSEFSKCLDEHQSPMSTTPIRLLSPSRLRKKRSEFSLTGNRAKMGVSKGGLPSESPSPPGKIHEEPRPSLGHKHRAQSTEDFGTASSSAEQLSRLLRRFRRNVGSGKPIGDEQLKQLELELYLTQEYVSKRANRQKSGHQEMR